MATGGFLKNGHHFARVRFIGSKEQAAQSIKAHLAGGFENSASFAWIADNKFKGLLRNA